MKSHYRRVLMLVWYDILPLKTSPSGQGGTAVPSVIFDVNSTDGQILTEPAMAVMAAMGPSQRFTSPPVCGGFPMLWFKDFFWDGVPFESVPTKLVMAERSRNLCPVWKFIASTCAKSLDRKALQWHFFSKWLWWAIPVFKKLRSQMRCLNMCTHSACVPSEFQYVSMCICRLT